MAVHNLRSVASGTWVAGAQSRILPLSTALVVNAALAVLIVVGFAARVQAALRQPLFVDEAFSLLAIDAIGARGAPILPTGVIYLHGATLSYFLAPWLPLGWVQADDLTPFRIVSAFASAAAIFLTFRLARSVGGSQTAALLAAAFIALDPASIEWGGYVRMYALGQTLVIAVALLFVMLIRDEPVIDSSSGDRLRLSVGFVVLFWLAVYTHLATVLLWPALAIAAVVIFGRGLYRHRKDLALALVACLAAPFSLVAMTGSIGAGAGTKISARSEGIPGISFLGDDKVNFQQMLNPDPSVWASLFGPGPLEHLLPLVMTVASTILLVRCLLRIPERSLLFGSCRAVTAILVFYWTPVLILAFLSGDTATRYGLFLIPLGCVILGLAIGAAVEYLGERLGQPGKLASKSTLLIVALVAVILVHDAVGVARVFQVASSGKRDLTASLRYVNDHRQPGEWVLSTIPPPMSAYVLNSAANLVFLPGGENSSRTLRYTRISEQGKSNDYWIGGPALRTTDGLCRFLATWPNTWLVVDEDSWNKWGYNSSSKSRVNGRPVVMRAIVQGTSTQVFSDHQAFVYRVKPVDQWTDDATQTCNPSADRKNRKSQSND